MPATETIPTELAWLIQRELNLNQEVGVLRNDNNRRKEKLKELMDAETMPEKIGLTRVPFSMKKSPTEALRDDITEKASIIREKIMEWKQIKQDIEQKVETFLMTNDQDFKQVCQSFGVIAEIRAIVVNLRNRVVDYLARTGQVRGAMAAGYNSATQTFSRQALDTIKQAIDSGYAADGLQLKIQERESLFSRLVANSFASNIHIPESYPLSLGDFTESLRVMPLEAANAAVIKSVQNCEHLLNDFIPKFEQSLQQAEALLRQACLSQIDTFWQSLRAQVWAHLHQIRPMPKADGMSVTTPAIPMPKQQAATQPRLPSTKTPAPFSSQKSPYGAPPVVTEPAIDPSLAAAAKASEPKEADKGRGLTSDYFEKSGERRSRLKLRTPN